VLVADFAWLDRRVQGEPFSGRWALEAGGVAAFFFVAGILVERSRLTE
jgi:hypothetical protein